MARNHTTLRRFVMKELPNGGFVIADSGDEMMRGEEIGAYTTADDAILALAKQCGADVVHRTELLGVLEKLRETQERMTRYENELGMGSAMGREMHNMLNMASSGMKEAL